MILRADLSWMLILPEFKSFVKALNFYIIQGSFTIDFSGAFLSFLALNILFGSKNYFKKHIKQFFFILLENYKM